MAQTLQNMDQSKVISSLDTYNYEIPANGMHMIHVQMNEVPPSGLSVVIERNSVQVASSGTLAASQSIIDLQIVLNCTAGDDISIIVSSSEAEEAAPNAVKGIINIHPGSM